MSPSLAERPPEPRATRAGILLALGFLAFYAVLHIAYHGVTVHSIDQIRDVAVASDIVAGKAFPNSSSTFLGTYAMPPAFHYLLAVPLFGGSLEAAQVSFGLIFIAALVFAWGGVHASFGDAAGALFAAICSPFWISLYAHSTWNAGLTYSLSAVVMGCLLRALAGSRGFWAGTVLAYALLVQLHLSALPLAPGLALAFLARPRESFNRWTLGVLALALLYFGVWFGSGLITPPASDGPSVETVLAHVPIRVLDAQKWLDAAILPFRIASGFSPAPLAIPYLLLALSIMVLVGALLSLGALRSRGEVRILWLIVALWLLAAMSFLGIGLWYYLDVIYPWLYCLSALGLSLLVARRVASASMLGWASGILFALSAIPQLWLYVRLDRQGEMFVRMGSLTFPQNASLDLGGLISSRTQDSYYDFLEASGGCADRIGGMNEMVLRDYSARYRLRACPAGVLEQAIGRQFYFTSAEMEKGFSLTRAQTPVWRGGRLAVYLIDGPVPSINGTLRNALYGTEHLNYALFRPAALPGGLSISVAAAAPVLLRVALRCGPEPDPAPVSWRIVKGEAAGDVTHGSLRALGHRYLDYEVPLRPAAGDAGAVMIEAEHLPQDCDVSAFARPE